MMQIENGALVEIEIGRHRFIARVLPARKHVKNLERRGVVYSPDYLLVRTFDPDRKAFLEPTCYLRRRVIRVFPRLKHARHPLFIRRNAAGRPAVDNPPDRC